METGKAYQAHLSMMKNFEAFEGRRAYQAPFTKKFEVIYEKAMEVDIKLDNAKSFLKDLSTDELRTLQKYAGLADSINVDAMTPEGAYNLLMHDNEKFDFNGDSLTQVGKASWGAILPSSMPKAEGEAFIAALNSLDEKDKLHALMIVLAPPRINIDDNSPFHNPDKMDYRYLKNRVHDILNPPPGAYSSEEIKTSIGTFWELFDTAFKGKKTSSENNNIKETDRAVEQFLKDLKTKGAVQFLADYNQSKIDKKVEEFREKLIEELGTSSEALASIEEQVNDYRKQLLEEIRNHLDNNDETPAINTESMIQTLLNIKSDKETFSYLDQLVRLSQ